MAIKRIGKAILKSCTPYEGTFYKLEVTGEAFQLNLEVHAIKNELASLLPPASPNTLISMVFGTGKAIQEEYEEKLKEYDRQHDKLLNEYASLIEEATSKGPVEVYKCGTDWKHRWSYFLYKYIIYRFDTAEYSDEKRLLLIMDVEDKERRKFERLKNKFSEAETIDKEKGRSGIPEKVRIAVWRRDDGKCAKCGSRENLEYDHIIPVSKGGNNTVRNIELLCEKCNREKSANIM